MEVALREDGSPEMKVARLAAGTWTVITPWSGLSLPLTEEVDEETTHPPRLAARLVMAVNAPPNVPRSTRKLAFTLRAICCPAGVPSLPSSLVPPVVESPAVPVAE